MIKQKLKYLRDLKTQQKRILIKTSYTKIKYKVGILFLFAYFQGRIFDCIVKYSQSAPTKITMVDLDLIFKLLLSCLYHYFTWPTIVAIRYNVGSKKDSNIRVGLIYNNVFFGHILFLQMGLGEEYMSPKKKIR